MFQPSNHPQVCVTSQTLCFFPKKMKQHLDDESLGGGKRMYKFGTRKFIEDASSSLLMQVDPKEPSMVVSDEMQNGVFPQAQTIIYNSKVLK
ncbi:hypothetical protein NC652_029006 [Populus alba x Populus x berolinensis]|nr:hypothetical protein NC652_029006 [Populus alba x Populus x berolinensis]